MCLEEDADSVLRVGVDGTEMCMRKKLHQVATRIRLVVMLGLKVLFSRRLS